MKTNNQNKRSVTPNYLNEVIDGVDDGAAGENDNLFGDNENDDDFGEPQIQHVCLCCRLIPDLGCARVY